MSFQYSFIFSAWFLGCLYAFKLIGSAKIDWFSDLYLKFTLKTKIYLDFKLEDSLHNWWFSFRGTYINQRTIDKDWSINKNSERIRLEKLLKISIPHRVRYKDIPIWETFKIRIKNFRLNCLQMGDKICNIQFFQDKLP